MATKKVVEQGFEIMRKGGYRPETPASETPPTAQGQTAAQPVSQTQQNTGSQSSNG